MTEYKKKLSTWDYVSLLLVIGILFALFMVMGLPFSFEVVSIQTARIVSIYNTTYLLGMMVSAIFMGTLLWIVITFRDRGIEN
ncbi:MAG: hypothetical protein O7B32_03955 [Thaumarchaeota archaeon]|nr:hypothetical protein [Nitrososphaerota archaeon]MCZ6725065.1 hypothetical protein [Nitrososphaerota archaeon]